MAHKWPSCRIPKDLLMAEVLECFELQPDNSVFLELIPIFPKSHASQILGFKFQYYQHMEVSCPVPFGLYKLTALLVKQDFIDIDIADDDIVLWYNFNLSIYSALHLSQFFDGYEYHETSFGQTYQCYPASFLEKSHFLIDDDDEEFFLEGFQVG
ncbi:uncharacterized protein LOC107618983 isoform X1 [Arachis ipaensis]|uniref:uncharacterized protein LOC107618983 isoform X1 n=1 Tax=Arachis ipaensis TaxID=130454 RepID=UPI000A2B94C1|nr:uncharacterized protein LOC107618983 isoform X1 [Arachis ipaensis]XP_020967085.1 uncharacterized protein LOC107618983 isoform X1 [Arachis ipaensis]